jgi:hypothetical protein
MEDSDMVRRSPNGSGKQVRNLLLQDRVGRQANGIGVAFGFQKFVDPRLGEGGIGPEIAAQLPLTIAFDHRLHHDPPTGADYGRLMIAAARLVR